MAGKGKRKADDNLTGTRHPAARRDPTAGDDLAGTSANNTGPTANAAGDGIAEISPAMAWLLEVTSGYARGSPQFDGAARGAGGGSGYRGLSQSHGRAPQMPSQGMLRPPQMPSQGMLRPPQMPSQGMLRPPLGNPAGGRPPFTNQYHAPTGHGSLSGQSQYHAPTGNGSLSGPRQTGTGQLRGHSLGMLRPPLGNPAGGRPPFTYQYHAPTGHGSLPGQNQITGPLQPGTGQPRGHSGSGGPSWAISGAPVPVSPLVEVCPCCKKPPPVVFGGVAPLCVDCYTKIVISDVLEKHPEIRHVHPPLGAAAIGPSSSSSSSSAVGSGPICPACDHPLGTGNRACRFCHINGPPPPGLG